MAEYEVKRKHGNIELDWQEANLIIKASRINQRSDGSVSAELLITTTKKGLGPGLYQSRLSLTSSQTIHREAKQLTEKYPEWEEWEYYLTQTAHTVLNLLRTGDELEIIPILYTDIQPVHYLIDPLVIENIPNVIFGDGGSGKSRLALLLYMIISLPWPDNPLQLRGPDFPIPFVYLDWEADRESVTRELKAMVIGMGLENVDLLYRRCVAPLCEDIEAIVNVCEQANAEGVIIDSLGPAAGKGKLRDEDSATTFFAALRELNLTSIILAHNAKDQERNVRSIFGSVFFTNLSRSIWEVRSQQDYGSDVLDMGLMHTKSNYTKRHSPLAYRFNFNGVGTTIERTDPNALEAIKQRLSTKSKIVDALRSGPMDRETLKHVLEGVTDGNFRTSLHRLIRDNVVTEYNGQIALSERENLL